MSSTDTNVDTQDVDAGVDTSDETIASYFDAAADEIDSDGDAGDEVDSEEVEEGEEQDASSSDEDSSDTQQNAQDAQDTAQTQTQQSEQPQQPGAELTPEQRMAAYQKFEGDAINLLANQVYALNDDQVAELETNPKEAFPRLAALVHMRSMHAATNMVGRMLPQLVTAVLGQRETSDHFESQFFTEHSELADHKDMVLRYGQAYRQVNPQASPEDFIRDVGAQVKVALGLHNTGSSRKTAMPPHKPASSRASAPAPKASSTNVFEQLAEEFLEEGS